jgi:hypothetical protein
MTLLYSLKLAAASGELLNKLHIDKPNLAQDIVMTMHWQKVKMRQ